MSNREKAPICCGECGKKIIGIGAEKIISYIKDKPATVNICVECAAIKKNE